MEIIKEASIKKGEICTNLCDGEIVETYGSIQNNSEPIRFGGPPQRNKIISLSIGCNTCGLQYGLPVFKKTPPTEQVYFELSLYVAKIKKEITVEDLKNSKDGLPEELKDLKVGQEVYVQLPRSTNPPTMHKYYTFFLSKEMKSKSYEVATRCIE